MDTESGGITGEQYAAMVKREEAAMFQAHRDKQKHNWTIVTALTWLIASVWICAARGTVSPLWTWESAGSLAFILAGGYLGGVAFAVVGYSSHRLFAFIFAPVMAWTEMTGVRVLRVAFAFIVMLLGTATFVVVVALEVLAISSLYRWLFS